MKNIKTAMLSVVFLPLIAVADCEKIGNAAELTMNARQSGAAITTLLKATNEPLFKSMIIQAYSVMRFSSDEYKVRAAQDYRAKWELACLKVAPSSDQATH